MKRFTITQLLLVVTWVAFAISWAQWNWQALPFTGRLDDGWHVTFEDVVTKTHVSIDEDLIANSPAWDPKHSHPPLSAKQALHAVDRFRLSDLSETGRWKWSLTSIELHPLDAKNDKWCWIAQFDASVKSGGSSGQPIQHVAYVMMDGKVVGMMESDYYNTLVRLGLVHDPDSDVDILSDDEPGGVF